MGTNNAPLLADLFLHTFKYDFMVKTMKQDIAKAIQFSNTFRYIDDLFSINNVDFGNYISAIYPSELQLTATSTSSTEVCYLDTNIKTGSTKTPFRISIYDKRDDFTFRIVNFPHMDSNIPTNPAYGVYISQLVRYARICTSKVDVMNRFRGLSLRLRQQGFVTNLLQKSFNKFFNRHEVWGNPAGDEISNPGLNSTIVSFHYLFITYTIFSIVSWYVCARIFIFCACIIY